MAILSPTHHSSTAKAIAQGNHYVSRLHPALTRSLKFALIFQRLLSTTTLFLCVRLSIFTLYTTRLLLLNALYASQLVVLNLLLASRALAWGLATIIWRRTEKARKKLFFEFVIWLLNPHAVALFVFWPGWIVLGLVYLGCFFVR